MTSRRASGTLLPGSGVLATLGLLLLSSGLVGCATVPPPQPTLSGAADDAVPDVVACENEALTKYDGLVVLGPHPDDEMLAFAGLVEAYLRQDKPVRAVVVTDGDAYCEACVFWKNASLEGETCDALDLSNLETPEVDSFAEVRRGESTRAAGILGLPAPLFLGYPDTGLAAAWANRQAGELQKDLFRSDFSDCESCGGCAGYGAGPSSGRTAASLVESLEEILAATTPNTLVATTHWLDGHGDHAALGRFVAMLVSEMDEPRPTAFGVIHAHTPKDAAHPDCWYPTPEAPVCPCHDEERALDEPRWLEEQRQARYVPTSPNALPDDADYGEQTQLCIEKELWAGVDPAKRRIVDSYASQLGFLAREGQIPEALGGLIDCNGYLISFVRRTEPFVLFESGEDLPWDDGAGAGDDEEPSQRNYATAEGD